MYQGNEVFQLSWKHKLATVKSFKAHISSVSPLSEQLANTWNISFETLYSGQFTYQLSW